MRPNRSIKAKVVTDNDDDDDDDMARNLSITAKDKSIIIQNWLCLSVRQILPYVISRRTEENQEKFRSVHLVARKRSEYIKYTNVSVNNTTNLFYVQ
jgi:hypothetical protein